MRFVSFAWLFVRLIVCKQSKKVETIYLSRLALFKQAWLLTMTSWPFRWRVYKDLMLQFLLIKWLLIATKSQLASNAPIPLSAVLFDWRFLYRDLRI